MNDKFPCAAMSRFQMYLVRIPVIHAPRPSKKLNSAPHRSNCTSSIASGGVYDDWRDRVNVAQSSGHPQGSKSSASSNTAAAAPGGHLDGNA